jgi:hypothetical protein
MKHVLSASFLAAAALLTGCANSGFAVATKANTDRQSTYNEGFLEQATNDLLVINSCFLRTMRGDGVTSGSGSPVTLGQVLSLMNAFQCTSMAQTLRMTNTFLYAFLAKPDMGRVPAAPEEIAQSIVKDGMKFAIMKFGITAAWKAVESGNAAQAQIASEGIAAASKPPLVVDKPVIVTVPADSAVLPTAPVVTP